MDIERRAEIASRLSGAFLDVFVDGRDASVRGRLHKRLRTRIDCPHSQLIRSKNVRMEIKMRDGQPFCGSPGPDNPPIYDEVIWCSKCQLAVSSQRSSK